MGDKSKGLEDELEALKKAKEETEKKLEDTTAEKERDHEIGKTCIETLE